MLLTRPQNCSNYNKWWTPVEAQRSLNIKNSESASGCLLYLLGVGLWHFEQMDESVQQWHTDGPQQHLKAGLHQFCQTLHEAALAAVHFVVGRHHVGDEGVIGWARLWVQRQNCAWGGIFSDGFLIRCKDGRIIYNLIYRYMCVV